MNKGTSGQIFKSFVGGFVGVILLAVLLAALFGCGTDRRGLSVMSFNVRICPTDDFDGENNWKYRCGGILSLVRDQKPDVFCLQEALPVRMEYLDDSLGNYGRYGVHHPQSQSRGECNAIFYDKGRFDLVDSGTFWISPTPDEVSIGWDGAFYRTLVWVRLRDRENGGKDVFIFNTHFDHMGNVARMQSGPLVTEKIRSIVPEGAPVFLTGDFNANYDDAILDSIREQMDNARECAPHSDTLGSYHEWLSYRPEEYGHTIDHIWFVNVRPLSFETVTDSYGTRCLSDHYPIIARFSLKKP